MCYLFIYSIYHLSKAMNELPLVKVAAALVITLQGAGKTITQQTTEKLSKMSADLVKLHCPFTYWCTTDLIGHRLGSIMEMPMTAKAIQTLCVVAITLTNTQGFQSFPVYIHSFCLPCSQRVKYLPLQVALSLLAPIAEDDEIKKKSLRVSTMQCLLGNVRSLILE